MYGQSKICFVEKLIYFMAIFKFVHLKMHSKFMPGYRIINV